MSAYDTTSEDGAYTYTLDENGNATITEAVNVSGEVVIPAELDGHALVEIGGRCV